MSEIEKNESEIKMYGKIFFQKTIFLLGILVIVSSGIAGSVYLGKSSEEKEKKELIKISHLSIAAFDYRQIAAFHENINPDNPYYQRIREQLVSVNGSLENFDIKWIYLMKKEGNNWIFSVDPTDENASDYTPPGTPYDDYPKELDQVLDKNDSIIVGPYSDQWGEFISIFEPIEDLESGKVVGVLGIDVDAGFWRENILKSQIFPITICFFILLLWISFFFYLNKRDKHKKEIQWKEQRFKSVAEAMKDIVYRVDLFDKVTYISPSVKDFLGFSQDEVLGKSIMEIIPLAERSKLIDVSKKLSYEKYVTSLELILNRKDGKSVNADINITPIFEDKKLTGSQGVVRDITLRKRNEEKIKKQTEELKKSQAAILNILEDIEEEKEEAEEERDRTNAILYGIGEGVFVVDEKLRIIMTNKMITRLSGCSNEELIGQKYYNKLKFFINNEEKDEFIKESLKNGKIKEISNQSVFIGKDENTIPVSGNAAPLKNKKGEIIGCVVVFGDITKEREIDRMKSEFISVVSHQLRTPLTNIRWFAEMLLEGEGKNITKEQEEFIKEIYDSGKKMIKLVGDLLDISKIEAGKNFILEKKRTDLVSLLREAISDQKIMAEDNGVKIIFQENHPKALFLNIDSDKIKQVFQNLLINAIEYSPNGKSATLGFEDGEEEVIFSVKDSGFGIPLNQQKRVFEKFFRASNVLMTEDAGTGLGLYISKSIIDAHGGKIWFESEENKGTTFYCSFPKK